MSKVAKRLRTKVSIGAEGKDFIFAFRIHSAITSPSGFSFCKFCRLYVVNIQLEINGEDSKTTTVTSDKLEYVEAAALVRLLSLQASELESLWQRGSDDTAI